MIRTAVLLATAIVLAAPPRVSAAPPDSIAVGAPADSGASLAAPAPAAPTRDYLAEARAAYTPENRAYQRTRVWLAIAVPVYTVLMGLLLMFTRISVFYRDIANALGHRRYVRVLVFFALYATTMFVLALPLTWYQEFALEHQYGLSNQTWLQWFGDSCKALVFGIVITAVLPLLSLAWGFMERSPRRWWLWLAVGTLPVALVGALFEPIVFDPLFNKFTPLHDEVLRGEILTLASRAGIPGRNVYQVDMSKRTNKINAYVNGFGASQRIVLWDTMLQTMNQDEILFVMGHEMGHYALGHVWKFIAVLGVGAFVAFGLVALLVRGLLRAFGSMWGVTSVGDIASLPLLAAMLTVVSLLALPALNAVSRRDEHAADVYGLEITRDNDAAARALLKLGRDNRSDPEPESWVRLFLYSHPPLGERIRFALDHRPWERGEPNRYFRAVR